MHFVGIDPGKLGYISVLDTDNHTVYLSRIFFDKNNTLDQKKMVNVLDQFPVCLVFLEQIKGRGGWGATQTFNMGFLYGQVYSIVSRYPHRLIAPQTWQKVIHSSIKPTITAKERSRAAYRQLFPNGGLPENKRSIVDNNLLDAFLISVYGAYTFGKVGYVKINEVKIIEEKK
jgi:hypothetical protein